MKFRPKKSQGGVNKPRLPPNPYFCESFKICFMTVNIIPRILHICFFFTLKYPVKSDNEAYLLYYDANSGSPATPPPRPGGGWRARVVCVRRPEDLCERAVTTMWGGGVGGTGCWGRQSVCRYALFVVRAIVRSRVTFRKFPITEHDKKPGRFA